jgi:hypothetical protein
MVYRKWPLPADRQSTNQQSATRQIAAIGWRQISTKRITANGQKRAFDNFETFSFRLRQRVAGHPKEDVFRDSSGIVTGLVGGCR